jgi:hypothetical protein
MSDHLGGLARSARGEGVDLVPVTLPVFAAPPELRGASHELEDERSPAAAPAPAVPGAAAEAAPRRPGAEPAGLAELAGRAGAPAGPHPLPLPELIELPAPATAARPPSSRAPALRPLEEPPVPATATSPPDRRGPHPGTEATAADGRRGARAAAREDDRRAPSGDATGTAAMETEDRPGERPPGRRAEPPSAPASDRVPTASVTGVRRERLRPAATGERPASDPTEAGTIHVSIGRIEVRAAQPAAPPQPEREPPPPPAPRAPTLSLDDYLRRREGGGR